MLPALCRVADSSTHLLRRVRAIILATLALVVVLGPGSAPALADGPCGFLGTYETGAAEVCTFSWPSNGGLSAPFQVPDGVDEIGLRLVGGRGGGGQSSFSCGTTPGGNGGLVVGTTPITPGAILDVIVGGNGEDACKGNGGAGGYGGAFGAGGRGGTAKVSTTDAGGGGGGSSRVQISRGTLIAVAGGGGGGANAVGFGGNAGAKGGGTVTRSIAAAGGDPGGQTAGGAVGASNFSVSSSGGTAPTAGSAASGGAGGTLGTIGLNYGASGGGGGGYYGGGGGGVAASTGGGGGGGSSYAAFSGASFDTTTDSPSIAISWNRSTPGLAATIDNATTAEAWGTTGRLGQRARGKASLGAVNGGPTPTGSVTFTLYSASGCVGSASTPETKTVGANGQATSSNSAALALGSYSYRAEYSGDLRYRATSTCVDFEATRYPQTVAFTNDGAGRSYGDHYTPTTGFTSPAGTTSHPAIEIKVASDTAGVCRLDGSEIRFIGAGTCTLEASAPGDGTYDPAPTVTQTFSVAKRPLHIDTAGQTINRGERPTPPFGGWSPRYTDLLSQDSQADILSTLTGAPDCQADSYPDVPGEYPGILRCLPGTLSHPNYEFVAGSGGDLTVQPVSKISITPATKDLGQVTAKMATTFDLDYSVLEGDDVTTPELAIESTDADVEVTNMPLVIPSGTTATLKVAITPRDAGPFTVKFRIVSGPIETELVTVTGEASYTYDFGKSFTSNTTLRIPEPASAVVVDTFDRDPYPDIAVASASTGHVWILRGRGNGTFLPAVQAEGEFLQGGLALATGDIDGDGDIDITTGGRFYLNDGNGTFAANDQNFGAMKDAALADLDADGDLDLVIQVSEIIAAVRNDGTGHFDASSFLGAWSVNDMSGFLVADIDRDGDTDIGTISNEPNNQSNDTLFADLFRNDGQGAFTEEHLLIGEYAANLAVGDFNGDARPDLYYGPGYFPGRPDGSFGAPVPTRGQGGVAMVVTDFDGDQRDDELIAFPFVTSTQVIYGSSTATNFDRDRFEGNEQNPDTNDPADVAAGDFDRDGRMDAVVVRSTTGVSLLRNGRGEPNRNRLAAKITEARFGGDSYLKIVNTRRDAPIRMDGWRLAFSNGLRATLPLSSPVPPGGSVFIGRPVNAGGSLGSYVRSAIGMPAGLNGVRLDGADSTPSDAIGVTTSDADYREGAGTPERTFVGQGAYIRRSSAGRPVDTDDNAADFVAVDTRADEGSGTILGAPRPDRPDGPTNRNDVLQSSLVDPAKGSTAAPNRVVSGGYMTINRTVTNCSGGLTTGACANADPSAVAVKITKLRFRVTALSTYGTSNAALLRLVGSDDASYGPLGVRGLPLDGPSAATGGGLNSSQVATQLLPDGGLAPGESINVAFRFTVDRGGAYTFGYDTEDDVIELRKATAPPAAEEQVPEAPPVPDSTKGTLPQSAASSAPASATTPPAATPTPLPSTAPKPATGASKKTRVTKKQFKRLRAKARKRAKICKPKRAPAAKTTPRR